MSNVIKGKAFVVLDDIDTDQIIPARYMTTMDPATLAKNAMSDLDPVYQPRFLNAEGTCDYSIIIARKNFGCGSSREHAPIALSAAGIKAVVANTFARIYYRNSVNGGRKIYPLETQNPIADESKTGDEVEIDLAALTVKNLRTGKTYTLQDYGPIKDIIEAGGLTSYNKNQLKRA
jgi:3-isopropylmalate/(R)-2-methylmalate dehydratase small subunit